MIEMQYNKTKACVDKVTQSILAKAFRGELMPQDPKDELQRRYWSGLEQKEKFSNQRKI